MKIDKLSTCGFVFALFSMVWALRVNVVDGPLLWQRADLRPGVAKKPRPKKTVGSCGGIVPVFAAEGLEQELFHRNL